MSDRIRACLIVDDAPIAAAYWMRCQQHAFGYRPTETGWGARWRELEKSAFMRVSDLRMFADFVSEYGVRGKFTFLPCPAGLGRVDEGIRGMDDGVLGELLSLMRERIAPCFDITPEILTHTMAWDIHTRAMLPHTETAWLSHLLASGQTKVLHEYLRTGWEILKNVGIRAHGLTLAGMEDKSGIAAGRLFVNGHYLREMAEILMETEKEFTPGLRRSFLFAGACSRVTGKNPPNVPSAVWESAEGACVREIFCLGGDPASSFLHGEGDIEAAVDRLVSPDLERGQWIEAAEHGQVLSIVTHVQTLNAANTGLGLQMLRKAVGRLRDRYGKRLLWQTADELCAGA